MYDQDVSVVEKSDACLLLFLLLFYYLELLHVSRVYQSDYWIKIFLQVSSVAMMSKQLMVFMQLLHRLYLL